MELCPETDIEGEIDDSESTNSKVIGAKRKIDLALKRVRDVPPVLPHVVDATAASKPRLHKLTLPKFRDVTNWSAFWVHTSQRFMTMLAFL